VKTSGLKLKACATGQQRATVRMGSAEIRMSYTGEGANRAGGDEDKDKDCSRSLCLFQVFQKYYAPCTPM
jgi:hypothetical protein